MLPLQKGLEAFVDQHKEPILDHADPRCTESTEAGPESNMPGRTPNGVEPLVTMIGAGIGGSRPRTAAHVGAGNPR